MKSLTRSGLTSAILITSAFSLIQSLSPANAQVVGNWGEEKEIFTPSPTFPKPKNEGKCNDFDMFDNCYEN